MLDGHKLSLQLSRSSNASSDSDKKKAKAKRKGEGLVGDEEEGSSKLVVRNVAFEATRKDLVALFGPFGHLKSCRWVHQVIFYYSSSSSRCCSTLYIQYRSMYSTLLSRLYQLQQLFWSSIPPPPTL